MAGGPTRETSSDVFALHRLGLESQGGCVVEHEVVEPINDPTLEFVDGGSARWPNEAVRNVAQARQRFMNRCNPFHIGYEGWDGLFMVDSDVICGPGVLDRLLAVDADVVYGVFWTRWPRFEQPLPQVWDVHPYGYSVGPDGTMSAEMRRLWEPGVQEVEVLGGGACTLFRGKAFRGRYWPLMRGLQSPGWYGEDRSYCVRLEAMGIRQVAVTGLPISHLYEPSQQTPEAVEEAKELVGL